MVILTGGEPALWIDEAFIDMLHKAGKYICIETNGTRPLPKGIDWVTCSPKEGAPLKIDHMDEVKVVYLGQDLSSYIKLPAKYHFLQPCRYVSKITTSDLQSITRIRPNYPLITLTLSYTFNNFKTNPAPAGTRWR